MSDDSKEIDQDEIEALLRKVQDSDKPEAEEPAGGESAAEAAGAGDAAASGDEANKLVDQSEIEALLGNAPSSSSSQPQYSPTDPNMEVSADELDRVLAELQERQAAGTQSVHLAEQATVPKPKSAAASRKTAKAVPVNDIDLLLQQTQEALDSIDNPVEDELEGIAPFSLEEFKGTPATTDHATLDLLRDVELDLKIELGRTQMHLEDVLKLSCGAVVPLDKLAGDPVDVYVNGRLVARGEVLVLNDNFCVRVAELVTGNLID